MADISKPSGLTENLWASGGEIVEPSDTKKQQGWTAEIPPFQFENYLQNKNEQAIAHIVQHGISAWDANTEYQANTSYVQDEDGEIWRALQTNSGINPKFDDQNIWEKPFDFDTIKKLATEDYAGVVLKATQQDIDVGTEGARFVVAGQLKTAVENLKADSIKSGTIGSIFLPDATVDAKGAVQKARQQDIDNGTGATRYVNPIQLKSISDGIKATTAGVALQGNSVVTAGTVENYQITNYSSFDTYQVNATFDATATGSVSITDDLVSITVDSGSTGSLVLTVTKSGVDYNFNIAIGASQVDRPSLTYPSNGSTAITTNVTFTSTSFKTTPSDFGDTHQSSDWEVATDSGFSNIVASSYTDTSNLTQWQVTPELSAGTVYYVHVRYTGASLGTSAWSQAIQFTTANAPNTPSVTSPANGATDVGDGFTITSSAFSSPVSETHQSSDWEIRQTSDNTLVWSSYNDTINLTSIDVPSGNLAESTEYQIRVRYYGSQLGVSAWGTSTFTTEAQFFKFDSSSAGQAYGGGYYAGANIVVNGTTYALVVAPKSQGGENSSLAWKASNTTTSGPDSTYDGKSNTAAMISAGASVHPAANFCNNLTINGYTDWHLPSADELEICYRYLKPTTQSNYVNSSYGPETGGNGTNPQSDPVGAAYTSNNPSQTSVAIFRSGGGEDFSTSYYWSSSQYSSANAWYQRFYNGNQNSTSKTPSFSVRAVRWVAV